MLQRFLRRSSCAAGLASLIFLTGCGDPGSAENPQLELAAIVNGERSSTDDDEVVQVTAYPTGSPAQSCTGTLVAPNIVLTALHCVAQFSGGNFSCMPDGSLSTANPGDGSLGELATPSRVEVRTGVFPATAADAYGAKLFGTGSNQICRNDLAIIVLDRDLAMPLASLRLDKGVELGESMRIVGYGATENSASVGRYSRSQLRVVDRGQDAGGSTTNTAAPRTLVIGQGPCHGDSGGPLLSESSGALVGVYSLVSGATCTAVGVRNVYTRLEPFADLVQTAFTYASQTPILEPGDTANAAAAGAAGATGVSSGGSGSSVSESGGLGAVSGAIQRPGGSGSRQDGNCGCRATRSRPSWPLALSVLLGALALSRRRRRACSHGAS